MNAAAAPRYENSGLHKDDALALLARVERAFSGDRVYEDAGLTLGRLATAVDATSHQLSEVLNRYANVTFHELLNRHRVEAVKAQLCDVSADGYTVEGMTPTEFRSRRG